MSNYVEKLFITIIAIILAVLTAIQWDTPFLETTSSILFQIFLPGIWVAMQFSGGPHNASELNVMIGVFLQVIFVYWGIKKINGVRLD